MSNIIVKLSEDKYVEWSSVVDAPSTHILSRNQMLEYLKFRYGTSSGQEERLVRADLTSTSSMVGVTLESLLKFNRAGENETSIDLVEILERYK